MKHNTYSDKDIINACKQYFSCAGVIKHLGLKLCGGNYSSIYKKIKDLEIDVSHWTGQGWNKNKQFKQWTDYSSKENLKKHLILSRGFKCESCTLSKWLNKDILLELHHIDGNVRNNNYDNLQLLCLNCHAQTPNFRNRKLIKHVYECIDCGKKISKKSKRCNPCYIKCREETRCAKQK